MIEDKWNEFESTQFPTTSNPSTNVVIATVDTEGKSENERTATAFIKGARGAMMICCICGTWIHEYCLDVDLETYPYLGEWNGVKCRN